MLILVATTPGHWPTCERRAKRTTETSGSQSPGHAGMTFRHWAFANPNEKPSARQWEELIQEALIKREECLRKSEETSEYTAFAMRRCGQPNSL